MPFQAAWVLSPATQKPASPGGAQHPRKGGAAFTLQALKRGLLFSLYPVSGSRPGLDDPALNLTCLNLFAPSDLLGSQRDIRSCVEDRTGQKRCLCSGTGDRH